VGFEKHLTQIKDHKQNGFMTSQEQFARLNRVICFRIHVISRGEIRESVYFQTAFPFWLNRLAVEGAKREENELGLCQTVDCFNIPRLLSC
jgi:hypothetical protein